MDFKIDSMKEELDFSESDYSELQILGTQLKPEIFKFVVYLFVIGINSRFL